MSKTNVLLSSLILLMAISAVPAQQAEVTLSLNEAFFNSFLDSVFTNFDPPEFPIAKDFQNTSTKHSYDTIAFSERPAPCAQSVKIMRESGGVRTSVRIGGGRINVPLAFTGTYSPPFIGCVEFAGWADTNIDLEFDRDGQRLIGRATVAGVNLNGTGGVGSTLIAKMIQGSIDKKLNPIDILRLDKLSFTVPVQNSGSLVLRAVGVRPEILTGMLTVHVDYQFLKG
jgi:hypothetical protein